MSSGVRKIMGFQVNKSWTEVRPQCRRGLIPAWAAGVIDHLSLDNPLPLIIPPRAVAVVTAVALPIITHFALVLDLSNAVLSPCPDAVRYLDQFQDVLLKKRSTSAVYLDIPCCQW